MDLNPNYLIQVEGWRGVIRQSEDISAADTAEINALILHYSEISKAKIESDTERSKRVAALIYGFVDTPRGPRLEIAA